MPYIKIEDMTDQERKDRHVKINKNDSRIKEIVDNAKPKIIQIVVGINGDIAGLANNGKVYLLAGTNYENVAKGDWICASNDVFIEKEVR